MAGNQMLKGWKMGNCCKKVGKNNPGKSLWPFFGGDGEVKRPFQKAVRDLKDHLDVFIWKLFNLSTSNQLVKEVEKKNTAFISALVYEGLHSLKVT